MYSLQVWACAHTEKNPALEDCTSQRREKTCTYNFSEEPWKLGAKELFSPSAWGGGAVGGGGRRELAGPGVEWTFELNLGEGQNLKWRQEQERQEQESRQNKELREKNTEKSVREQKKTGLMQRVRGDSV